jgi:hypothetical protein
VCGEDIVGYQERGGFDVHDDCYLTKDLARSEAPPPETKPKDREE